MATNSLADLTITSGVDGSGLSAGLDAAKAQVEATASSIAQSLGGIPPAASAAGDSLDNLETPATKFSDAAQKIIDTQGKLEAKVGTLKDALAQLQQGYDAGTVSAEALQRAQDQLDAVMTKAGLSTGEAGSGAERASGQFDQLLASIESNTAPIQSLIAGVTALGEAFVVTETLKEFVTETLSAYDAVQKADNAITALIGSAATAKDVLDSVEEIAKTQPFSFPELAGVAQKMAAFHISADNIPALLQDIGNASRATGNGFDAIASAVERVSSSGQISARQLVQLGVSWDDLAKAAGASVAEVQELVKKGGQSAAADLALLQKAMEQTSGVMQDVPLSVGEQWTVLQNNLHVVYADIGEGLSGMASGTMDTVKNVIIPVLTDLAEAFKGDGQSVGDFVSALENAGSKILDANAKALGLDGALQKIRDTVNSAGIKWTDFLPTSQAAATIEALADAINRLFPQVYTNVHNVAQAENLAAAAGTTWSEGTKEWVDQAQQQINTVKNLTSIVDELRGKQDGNATSALALAEAQKALQKATDDLAKSGGALVKSAQDLTLASDQATAKVAAAQAVYDAIKAKYDAGTASALAQAAAQKQLNEAISAASTGVISIDNAENALVNKQNELEATARNNVLVFEDLLDKYETGSPIIQKALDAAVSSMKAANLTMDDITSKPGAWSVEMVKAGEVVQGSTDDVRATLEKMIADMDPDAINAVDTVKGHMAAAGTTGVQAFQGAGDACQQFTAKLTLVTSGLETQQGTLTTVGQMWASMFGLATASVGSLNDALDQTYALLNSLNDAASSVGDSIGKASGRGGGGLSLGGKSGTENFILGQALIEQEQSMLADGVLVIGPTAQQINQELMTAVNTDLMNSSRSSTSAGSTKTVSAPKTSTAPTATPTKGTTGNSILDFLNSFTTAVSNATTAAAGSSTTLPDWITQLDTALKSISSSTTQASGATLPDWVTQLDTTIQQFTQGKNLVDMTQLGTAIQGILDTVPTLNTALTQVGQVTGDTALALTNVTYGVTQALASLTAAATPAGFTQSAAQIQGTINTIAPFSTGSAGFSRVNPVPLPYVSQPLLNPIASGGMPIPNLGGTMSQVTNSSGSSGPQVAIGQVNVTGNDGQALISILQRSGVRM